MLKYKGKSHELQTSSKSWCNLLKIKLIEHKPFIPISFWHHFQCINVNVLRAWCCTCPGTPLIIFYTCMYVIKANFQPNIWKWAYFVCFQPHVSLISIIFFTMICKSDQHPKYYQYGSCTWEFCSPGLNHPRIFYNCNNLAFLTYFQSLTA